MTSKTELDDYLKAHVDSELSTVISAVADVAVQLSARISAGPLGGALGDAAGVNTDGDQQKVLDIEAHEAFVAAFHGTPVRWIASEECETAIEQSSDGKLAVAIDPLDGSSNIDVNVSIGTIFSVFDSGETADETFLRPGSEQLAAGYVIYGPQTAFLLTFGNGVLHFVLEPASHKFVLVSGALQIPSTATEFAINASNFRHWSAPVRAYIDDCLAGDEGPRGKNFNMRWVASLVAEAHRIIIRGGIFLYPADARAGYEKGRLRMVYECAPIAMLVEQAGGQATDGSERILDQVPANLHARSPLVFGSTDKVARVTAYHDLPAAEVSPLFGTRGLFSA
ncbi:class 1 fructose-bisphosphatase [Thalassospiraceae bacterium LMO-JJ14]|nr:class 1 fructose-bisphosphatase [Thalassospiraceae bacterium LMO-JJ14]